MIDLHITLNQTEAVVADNSPIARHETYLFRLRTGVFHLNVLSMPGVLKHKFNPH
ncbi:hypothetical protein VD0003_g10308 [Verticillium dahliae]|nr:hypothetical protein VD0003_g10308 [Verticillium dahliae]